MDVARDLVMFKSRNGGPASLEAHVRVSDIEEAYTEEHRRLPPTVFRTGLILVFLIGAYLAVGEHLDLKESIEKASYIFFLGLSSIGFVLIVIYFILKEKVLILETKKGKLEIGGDLKELNGLRFDIHSLAKGRLLGREEGENGQEPDLSERPLAREAKGEIITGGGDGCRKVLTCPQCGSGRLYYEAGLMTGYKYHCKSCDYIGVFVIERES